MVSNKIHTYVYTHTICIISNPRNNLITCKQKCSHKPNLANIIKFDISSQQDISRVTQYSYNEPRIDRAQHVGEQNIATREPQGDYSGRGARGASLRPAPPNTLSDLRAAPLDDRVAANNMSDSINVVFPRKLLKEFISLYQRLPCLWDKHCASYKMKHKRHEAITKLTQLVQMYDPSATRVHVLRKIESLRACVRREYKRVQNSKKTAENESEIYTPHLWYYDLFSFMFQTEDTSQEFEKTKESVSSPQSTTVVRMYK